MKAWILALQVWSGGAHRHEKNYNRGLNENTTISLSITEGLSFTVLDTIRNMFWDHRERRYFSLCLCGWGRANEG